MKSCVQCHESHSVIRKSQLAGEPVECEVEVQTEDGSDSIVTGTPPHYRHRFKPYTEKELAGQKSDEEEICRQMGDFADFCENEE